MGTWGSGPFDNDAAADWLDQLEEDPSLDMVRDALAVIRADRAVSADAAAVAVASAEVVAAILGAPSTAVPANIIPALRDQAGNDEELRRLARDALDRVSGSELAAVWDEADGDEWRRRVRRLQENLSRRRKPASGKESATSVYTCSRRGHTKRLKAQTSAGLNVAAWHADTAVQGSRERLVGVRAELLDLVARHDDASCSLRIAALALIPEVEACIEEADRSLIALVAGIAALREQVPSGAPGR